MRLPQPDPTRPEPAERAPGTLHPPLEQELLDGSAVRTPRLDRDPRHEERVRRAAERARGGEHRRPGGLGPAARSSPPSCTRGPCRTGAPIGRPGARRVAREDRAVEPQAGIGGPPRIAGLLEERGRDGRRCARVRPLRRRRSMRGGGPTDARPRRPGGRAVREQRLDGELRRRETANTFAPGGPSRATWDVTTAASPRQFCAPARPRERAMPCSKAEQRSAVVRRWRARRSSSRASSGRGTCRRSSPRRGSSAVADRPRIARRVPAPRRRSRGDEELRHLHLVQVGAHREALLRDRAS